MKFAREFLCGPVFSSHPGADLPGNCVYLSKTPPASPPWVHQVRFPPAGSEVPGLCTPVHNSVFLETVMTPSEQGCLNRRHGNTACWERSSSTRASHGVGPGAWSSLAPGGSPSSHWGGPGLGPASLLGVSVSRHAVDLSTWAAVSPFTKGASCPSEYAGCISQDALVPKAGSVWFSRSLG